MKGCGREKGAAEQRLISQQRSLLEKRPGRTTEGIVVDQRAKPARVLEVKAMFEPCRIARQEVARAYERLMPTRRHKVGASAEPVKIVEPEDEIRSRQGGGQ